jgi:hypothetical protein
VIEEEEKKGEETWKTRKRKKEKKRKEKERKKKEKEKGERDALTSNPLTLLLDEHNWKLDQCNHTK